MILMFTTMIYCNKILFRNYCSFNFKCFSRKIFLYILMIKQFFFCSYNMDIYFPRFDIFAEQYISDIILSYTIAITYSNNVVLIFRLKRNHPEHLILNLKSQTILITIRTFLLFYQKK